MREPGRDQKYILNMDQTPILFLMVPKTTLNKKGVKTVNVRSSSGSTMRVTIAVAVLAAGDMLPCMMVFKGEKANVSRSLLL